MRSRVAVLALLVLSFCSLACSPSLADESIGRGFVDRVLKDDDGEHKYVVFIPKNYSSTKKWPVILSLHGAGERGSDGKKQLTIGLAPFVKIRQATYPFVVVFPQCETTKGRILTAWAADSKDTKRALKMLAAVEQELSIDTARRVLTGWSMGGYGAWSVADAHADMWSAVVTLSGGNEDFDASPLVGKPLWAFHGLKDSIVPVSESQKAVDAVITAGGKPKFTQIADGGHDIWRDVYNSDVVIKWMLNPAKYADAELIVKPRVGMPAVVAEDAPFKPAVEIPRAVYVRLGNNMLKTASYSLPKMVPKDALNGAVANIQDSTVTDGRTFAVNFTNISYSAAVTRAHLEGVEKDRMKIQLGLENLRMVIGATYVTGKSHSATAGAIHVVIGHKRPVWLTAVVAPHIENRQLRLKLVSSSFQITADNWYVTNPAGVSTRGLGMTEEKVSRGLVSGLYGSRARIEAEIRSSIPKMLKEVETKLVAADVSRLVRSMWPLPVYQPRIQVWPQEVSTDSKGTTLVFGVTAAAINPKTAPKQPKLAPVGGLSAAELPKGEELQVGFAANMMEPLTKMVIDEDMARIHVLDVPGRSFARFVQVDQLAAAIPEISRFPEGTEIWTELKLTMPPSLSDPPANQAPFFDEPADGKAASNAVNTTDELGKPKANVSDDAAPVHVPQRIKFAIPSLTMAVSVKVPGQSGWTEFAELQYDLAQLAQATISRPSYDTRALKLDWFGRPKVQASAKFAAGYEAANKTIHTDKLTALLSQSWRDWTSGGPASVALVDDIDFGASKLRLSEIGWKSPNFYASFAAAGIKLTNLADVDLVYEAKGPISSWGGPYTLSPGKKHEFSVPYAMTYRRKVDGRIISYSLPAGSHLEFRIPKKGGAPRLFQAEDMKVSKIASANNAK